MDSYFSQKHQFDFKKVLMLDLFQLLSSPDVNWWTGVVWITCGLLWCFYQLFGLSFWRHPFTAEHPLLRHWCRDTFLQTWWRNKLIYILNGLSVSTFSAHFYFYIYIYAFSRRFYPKRLTLHSSYSFTFYQLLLSLGIEPMSLALLAPCSTILATGKLKNRTFLVELFL